jgi:hypothetical protein
VSYSPALSGCLAGGSSAGSPKLKGLCCGLFAFLAACTFVDMRVVIGRLAGVVLLSFFLLQIYW